MPTAARYAAAICLSPPQLCQAWFISPPIIFAASDG